MRSLRAAAAVVICGLAVGGAPAVALPDPTPLPLAEWRSEAAGIPLVDPSGARVITAGLEISAHDALTGARSWTVAAEVHVAAAALSADGSVVFLTGSIDQGAPTEDFITRAFSAVDGAALWTSVYDGPAGHIDRPTALAVSADTVFVTGFSGGARGCADGTSPSGCDVAVIAYDAATGAQRWVTRYDGPAQGYDAPNAVAVAPGGEVIVTGASAETAGTSVRTLALDGATGALRWSGEYVRGPIALDQGVDIVVDPDGRVGYIAASVNRGSQREDITTIAYDVATGARLWQSSVNHHNLTDVARAIDISPDGRIVYTTGVALDRSTVDDILTIAHDTRTGARVWTAQHDGGSSFIRDDDAEDIVVSRDGRRVYVGGWSLLTANHVLAYDALTGAQLWVADARALHLAVSPDGTRLYTSGQRAALRFPLTAYCTISLPDPLCS